MQRPTTDFLPLVRTMQSPLSVLRSAFSRITEISLRGFLCAKDFAPRTWQVYLISTWITISSVQPNLRMPFLVTSSKLRTATLEFASVDSSSAEEINIYPKTCVKPAPLGRFFYSSSSFYPLLAKENFLVNSFRRRKPHWFCVSPVFYPESVKNISFFRQPG